MGLSIRFELRMDAVIKKGEHPLVLLLWMNGNRKKLSTGVKLFPELWDIDKQQIVTPTQRLHEKLEKKYRGNLPGKNQIINYQENLHDLKMEILNIESRFIMDGTSYNIESLLEKLNDKTNFSRDAKVSNLSVFTLIDRYINEHKYSRAPGSLKVYKTMKRHLLNFKANTKNLIELDRMDYSFMQSFQMFLIHWEEVHPTTKNVKKLNNTTIAKQISTLKAFLNYCKRKGFPINESFKDFVIRRERLEVTALNHYEFEKVFNLDLSKNRRLDQIRDIFCFSCVTGFRFSDLEQLRREHIKQDEIVITIKKTKEHLIVPLNVFSKNILEKYKEGLKPLPMISNQKFNKYLKELGQLAGIDEMVEIIRYRGNEKMSKVCPKYQIISAHTGRKTFATLSLEKGIPAETVMKITGHADYKSFQRYVKVTEERKRNEMQKAWGAPE